MASVLVHRTMSLDGYIAAAGHDMRWIFEHPPSDGWREIMERTGAIVIGRSSWEVNERDTGTASGTPYGGQWSGPIFVLTHRPFAAPAGVTVVDGDIREVIAAARRAAGARRVELFGAGVAAQAFAAGLVDEVIVHVAPVVLGDGVAFSPGSGRVDLELVDRRGGEALTTLHYRVRR